MGASNNRFMIVTVVAIVALIIYAAIVREEPDETVERRAPETAEVADAAAETVVGIAVAATFAGRVDEILVAPGDLVEADAPIARFESAAAKAALQEAEAYAALARQELNEANALRAQRAAELALSERGLKETEALVARGLALDDALEAPRAHVLAARAGLAAAEASVDRAKIGVVAADATLRRREAALAAHELRAPIAGRVGVVWAIPGSVAPAGAPVATLIEAEAAPE